MFALKFRSLVQWFLESVGCSEFLTNLALISQQINYYSVNCHMLLCTLLVG